MREILKKKYVRLFIFAALGFSLLASLALAVLVRSIPVAKTDIEITTELQENNSATFYNLMRAISFMADPLVAVGFVIIVAIFLIAIQYQREALFMLLVPVADLVGTIIKNIVERPRPSELTVKIYEQVTGSSFPSGHVIHAVVFFGYLFTLTFVVKKVPQLIRIALSLFSSRVW